MACDIIEKMRRRRLVAAGLAAGTLSACQWLLGIESRDVGGHDDSGIDATTSDSPATPEAATDAGVDARIDVEAGPPCEAGLRLCGGKCRATDDDIEHCGGCDHDCRIADAGCRKGLCVVEPFLQLNSGSYFGYFTANRGFFFITAATTTFTYNRAAQTTAIRPYAPGDELLDGFEASDAGVTHARRNAVSRLTAPDEQFSVPYIGPDPGPPILGLRMIDDRFLFVTGDDLYAGVDGSPATKIATISGVTTAFTIDPTASPALVYVSDAAGTIWTVPFAGGAPQTFVPAAGGIASAVAAAATGSYLLVATQKSLYSIDVSKKTPKKIFELTGSDAFVSDLRTAGPYAYVLDRGAEEGKSGKLVRVPAAGGDPIVLLDNLSAPLDLYLEDDLAWTLDRGRTSPAGGNTVKHSVQLFAVPR